MLGTRHLGVLILSFALCLCCSLESAKADIIFEEDFNGYVGNPNFPGSSNDLGGHRTIFGIPSTAQGATSDAWLAARFEFSDSGPIASDVGVLRYGTGAPGGPYGNPAGRVDDDAGLVIQLDLSGFTDVELAFDWRTFATESNDRLAVAYYVGDDLGSPGSAYDWFNDPALGGGSMSGSDPNGQANPWYLANWNEVFRGNSPNSFQQETGIALSEAGGNSIYLAFWLDNGDHDLGKIDNIVVSGTPVNPVPEPSSWALMTIGTLFVVATTKRRRRRVT